MTGTNRSGQIEKPTARRARAELQRQRSWRIVLQQWAIDARICTSLSALSPVRSRFRRLTLNRRVSLSPLSTDNGPGGYFQHLNSNRQQPKLNKSETKSKNEGTKCKLDQLAWMCAHTYLRARLSILHGVKSPSLFVVCQPRRSQRRGRDVAVLERSSRCSHQQTYRNSGPRSIANTFSI